MIGGELIFLLGVLALVVVGVVWGLLFSRDTKIHRRLFARQTQAIATAPPGATVRLTGTVEPIGEQLWAPMTRRRCVHYLTVLEERQYNHFTNSWKWVEVIRLEKSLDFMLRDASGVARVRMARAQVAIVRDQRGRSGFLDDPTPMELEFLEMQGEDPTNGTAMNRALRYAEGVLAAGEHVTVLGVAHPGDDTCRLVLEAPPDGHLLVTDEPTTVHSAARGAS